MERRHEITIDVGRGSIGGTMAIPNDASGLVIFAHGSGSSRRSGRNQAVAASLNAVGLATLLIDLLTPEEEVVDLRTREHRFDIPLLASRLTAALGWSRTQPDLLHLTVGYFGASTGAAAALISAAQRQAEVQAVVSRGGRPDLAGPSLSDVIAPTLLIVGGADVPVIGMNEDAMRQMRCEVAIEIVPGATHLFEEAGALEHVSTLAGSWFTRHLQNVPGTDVLSPPESGGASLAPSGWQGG